MVTAVITSGTHFPMHNWSAKHKQKATHPLYGIKLKVARANEHVEKIEGAVDTFRASHRIIREMEPDGVHEAVKLLVAPIPEMLPIIVGEVAFHLRSIFDNLACSLAAANGNSIQDVYFPFAGDRKEFELPRTQGKIRNLSDAAQKLICRLKPYKGGNNLLWAINRLRNTDTHMRLVSLVLHGPHWGTPTISTLFPAMLEPGVAAIVITYPQTFEDEIVLARCLHGAKIEYDTEPVIGVAFGDIEVLKGEDVITRLRDMINLTQRIVQIFERHFF